MANDVEFISGLSFKAPNDAAPEYVKAKGWIKNAELIAYLQDRIAKGEESTNFDVNISNGGKWYAKLDNWKPSQGNGTPRSNAPQTARRDPAPTNFADEPFDDRIPFATNRSTF